MVRQWQLQWGRSDVELDRPEAAPIVHPPFAMYAYMYIDFALHKEHMCRVGEVVATLHPLLELCVLRVGCSRRPHRLL